jgi:SAM-dependent methyltransferase
MTYKAIDIGCGLHSFILDYVHDYLPEWDGQVDVTNLDANPDVMPDVLHSVLEPMPDILKGYFDLAYMCHVLEHVPWRDSVSVAMEVCSLVKEGGYVLIAVPSMEWACKEVLRGSYVLGVLMMIYGGQDDEWQYHKSGYTKAALEVVAKRCGMKIYSLKETNCIITANDKVFNAGQWVLFMRKEESHQE